MSGFDLKFDFSTPEIADRVWNRVATAIRADEMREGFRLLEDEDLEMLAAAGDPNGYGEGDIKQ